jgi:LmbE family N-acetylglucosaminyl deacetylase
MKVLGVPEEKIMFGPFNTRVFPDSRQDILEYFLKLRKDFKPDLIFTHSKQDVHQDHNTMTDEACARFAESPCWALTLSVLPTDSFHIFLWKLPKRM